MTSIRTSKTEAHVLEGPGYRDVHITKGGRRFSKTLMAQAILLIAIGVFCLVFPGITVAMVSWLVGGSLLAGAVGSLAAFFIYGERHRAALTLIEAAARGLLGLVCILHPFASAAALAWLSGLGVLVCGFLVAVCGVMMFRVHRDASLVLLICGIVACVLGIVITVQPIVVLKFMSFFAIAYGVLMAVLACKAPKVLDALYGQE